MIVILYQDTICNEAKEAEARETQKPFVHSSSSIVPSDDGTRFVAMDLFFPLQQSAKY